MPGAVEPGSSAAPARRLAAIAAVALLLAGGATAAAQKEQGTTKKEQGTQKDGGKQGEQEKGKPEKPAGPPKLDAKSWILVDPLDDEVLAAMGPERERSIASTTKLMTAYLALKRLDPEQKLKAAPYDALAEESILGLAAGEKMTVKDLLYALLLPSANDAAETFAVDISGSEKQFVVQMNRTARTLGLDHTHYANPVGLDEAGNYSSAQDLVTLADQLMENDLFARIVDTPEAVLRSGSVKRRIVNHNTLLLAEPTVIGVKTGHTIDAGYVLVAAARRNGTTLISAVLGTRSEAARDAETEKLLDYGFSQYRARRPVTRGQKLAEADLDYRSEQIELVAKRDVPVSIRKGQQVRTRVTAPDEVDGPIEKGERLGRAVVTVDGRVAGGSPLVAASSAPAASFLQKAVATAAKPLYLIPAGLLVVVIGLLLAFRGRGEDDDPEHEVAPAAAPPRPAPAPTAPPAPAPTAPPAPAPNAPPAPQAKAPEAPSPKPGARPQPETEPAPKDQPKEPKGRRLRKERKPKGPRQRTPEERRQKAMERARRRKGRDR